MRDPQPIGRLIEEALEALGMGETRHLVEIQRAWQDLGDEPWLRETRPVGLEGGELVVEADNGGVASLVRYAAGRIQARLEERFGTETVRSVRVTVARPGRR